MNDIVIKIGELLVRAGIVTGVDLSEAEKLAKHMNLQFGQVLIMSGCLSEHDLDCALVAQQLVREELLTVDVACRALGLASQHQIPFEDALEALSVVPKYGAASVEMAELLADAAIIPGELLEQALMTSLATSVSLGELLVKENAISSSLIPVLNVMLADIGAGNVKQDEAINEIRKNHLNWQRVMQSGGSPEPAPAPVRTQEPSPVFVSQELMHAYEIYQPPQQPAQPAQRSQPLPEPLPAPAPMQPALPFQQPQSFPHGQSQLQQSQTAQNYQQSHPQQPAQQPQHLQQPQLSPQPQHVQQPPQQPQHALQPPHSQQPQPVQPQSLHGPYSPAVQSNPAQQPLPQPSQAPNQPPPVPFQSQFPLPSQNPSPDQSAQPADTSTLGGAPYAEVAPPAAPMSIHDVLSMFQQRNPVPESASQAVQRDQQAASWTAFVQSQSFDPNDVEPTTPPLTVAAEEPRLRNPEEVVQGTYSKTFDVKKSAELLTETFEQPVPDFEPAAEVIEFEKKASAASPPPQKPIDQSPAKISAVTAVTPEPANQPVPQSSARSAEAQTNSLAAAVDASDVEEDKGPGDNEQFHLLVELLIESSYFDREDIIESITDALRDEQKAVKLIEMLDLADAKAIMAATICAEAMTTNELTSGEAVAVLGDIKEGAEIHEALEAVNLELAVTVSANLQMMYDEEIDETFYVGDVSRTVDIFEPDDFSEDSKGAGKKEVVAPVVSVPPPVEPVDDSPPIAFGYGRERLKIAKRSEPQQEDVKEAPKAQPVVSPSPVKEPMPNTQAPASTQAPAASTQAPAASTQAPAASTQALPASTQAPSSGQPSGQSQAVIGGKKVSSLSEVFEKLSGVENKPSEVEHKPFAIDSKPAAAESTPAAVESKPASFSPASRTGTPQSAPKTEVASSSEKPVEPAVTEVPVAEPARFALPPISEPVPSVVESNSSLSWCGPAVDSAAAPATMTSDEDKKALRRRNSTTFNSLQAVFVPTTEQLSGDETKSKSSQHEEAVEAPKDEVKHEEAVEAKKDDVKNEVEVEPKEDVKDEEKVDAPKDGEAVEAPKDEVKDEVAVEAPKDDVKHEEEVEAPEEDKIEAKAPGKDKAKAKAKSEDEDEPEQSEEATLEDEEPVTSKKKPRSSKAKVRGGAKNGAAPKKPKRRK